MKEKLYKLIDVKSIVTLMITLVFCISTVLGRTDKDDLMTVFTVIISFYFGTQTAKKKGDNNINE